MSLHIGCSGWHYADWAGRVYDVGLSRAEWLHAYTERFDTVELNNSFYRLPEAVQFRRWREAVPPGFVFAVKASRFLTHIKRLRDPEEPLARLLDRARHLGSRLGPLLYQLPPRWIPDRDRLAGFLAALPRTVGRDARPLQHVIEFRDPRAYTDEVFGMLRDADVSLCLHDMPESAPPRVQIGPIAYVRMHGFDTRYGGRYSAEALADWAAWLGRVRDEGRDVYVYFNNDREANAVVNAEELRELMGTAPVASRARAGVRARRT